MKQNITIPTDLLVAINHLCTYVESKILFASIYYENDCPTFVQIQKVTGITQPNNYIRTRKQLLDLGYLVADENSIRIDTDAILNDYKEEFKC